MHLLCVYIYILFHLSMGDIGACSFFLFPPLVLSSSHLCRCFLSDEMRPVARIIDSILQCALDFRSCLRGGMWDVGMNQGQQVGRLPRINIAQVIIMSLHFYALVRLNHIQRGIRGEKKTCSVMFNQ